MKQYAENNQKGVIIYLKLKGWFKTQVTHLKRKFVNWKIDPWK